MAKGQRQAGQKQIDINNTAAAGAGAKGSAEFSSLDPFFTGEMTNPQGLGTAGVNAANTASQQSLGGATAGATGAGALSSARTRNSAGITEALDSSARGAEQTGSENAQQVQLANEMLKEQQRQEGAAGKSNLFNTETGQQTALLGQQAGNLGGRAAGGSFWQNTFQPIMNSLMPAKNA